MQKNRNSLIVLAITVLALTTVGLNLSPHSKKIAISSAQTASLAAAPTPSAPPPPAADPGSFLVPKAQAETASPPAEAASPNPVQLNIPAISLIAPVVKTGLETDGSLHVPSSPNETGWYELGTKPGDVGPAVITGHLDSAAGPGILYHLKNVKPGNEVDVIRDDGSVAVFTVDKLQRYPQDNFNTQAVYGHIPYAGLRLITCDGTYSRLTGHYSHDLVVYASLQTIRAPGAYQPR